MDFNTTSFRDLLQSLEPEIAKALAEIRHAQDDIDKAQSRLRFCLAAVHQLKKDIKDKDHAD